MNLTNQNLTRLQAAFEKTGITLYVWDAYRLCRANDLPIPPWVLCYFDQSAERIFGVIAREGPRGLPQQARRIGIALGFGGERGRPNIYEQMKRHDRDDAIVSELKHLVDQGWPYYAAYSSAAATFKLSISTINRVWLAAQNPTLSARKRRNQAS